MSLKAKQLRKLQKDLAPLLMPKQLELIHECFATLTPYPDTLTDLPDDEKKALSVAFVRLHPVLSLTGEMNLFDGVSRSQHRELWRAVVELDDSRGASFIWVLPDGDWRVNIDAAIKVLEELRARFQQQ